MFIWEMRVFLLLFFKINIWPTYASLKSDKEELHKTMVMRHN